MADGDALVNDDGEFYLDDDGDLLLFDGDTCDAVCCGDPTCPCGCSDTDDIDFDRTKGDVHTVGQENQNVPGRVSFRSDDLLNADEDLTMFQRRICPSFLVNSTATEKFNGTGSAPDATAVVNFFTNGPGASITSTNTFINGGVGARNQYNPIFGRYDLIVTAGISTLGPGPDGNDRDHIRIPVAVAGNQRTEPITLELDLEVTIDYGEVVEVRFIQIPGSPLVCSTRIEYTANIVKGLAKAVIGEAQAEVNLAGQSWSSVIPILHENFNNGTFNGVAPGPTAPCSSSGNVYSSMNRTDLNNTLMNHTWTMTGSCSWSPSAGPNLPRCTPANDPDPGDQICCTDPLTGASTQSTTTIGCPQGHVTTNGPCPDAPSGAFSLTEPDIELELQAWDNAVSAGTLNVDSVQVGGPT